MAGRSSWRRSDAWIASAPAARRPLLLSGGSGSDLLQTRPFPDERGSPSTAPLLAISRVSGVGWLVVVVIASLAAPGPPSPSDASRRICGLDDWPWPFCAWTRYPPPTT